MAGHILQAEKKKYQEGTGYYFLIVPVPSSYVYIIIFRLLPETLVQ